MQRVEPIIGAEQWFTFQDYEHSEYALRILDDLQIKEFRTCFSWADWQREGGPEWFDWFIGKLAERDMRLLPALFYTPTDVAVKVKGQKSNPAFPPARLEDYALFVREMIRRYGNLFDWIQIWNEPNNDAYWRFDLDPGFKLFAEMASLAMDEAHSLGKKVTFGGLSPADDSWLELMRSYGTLQKSDAVGVHFFPGTWQQEKYWPGWDAKLNAIRNYLKGTGLSHMEIHVTETGFSTWGNTKHMREQREKEQVEAFKAACKAPAERVYWHTLTDQKSDTLTDNVLNRSDGSKLDMRAYHFGLADEHVQYYKPLYYHLKQQVRLKTLTA